MKQKLILFFVSMLCMATTALAQTKITGTVLSQEDGEPVIGATVMIQGDKKGTVTDINGNFTISVPSGKINQLCRYEDYYRQPKGKHGGQARKRRTS